MPPLGGRSVRVIGFTADTMQCYEEVTMRRAARSPLHRVWRFRPRARLVPVLLGALCSAGLLTAPLLASSAQAELGVCGSDPVVILSNGAIIDLSATISDAEPDVQQVAYTLHAPAGTVAVGWINTYGPLGPKETLRFYADDAPNTYDSSTIVTTGQPRVSVSASARALDALGLLIAGGTASGWNDQPLRVHVSR